jgi:hypothetical protein
MISFFRLNTIDRFVVLLLVFAAIRALAFIWPPALTVTEMWWLTCGEALSRGELLYKDVYDDIAPLSALFYAGYVWVFGKQELFLRIMAAVAILFQMFQFGGICKRYQLFSERNFVPEFCFAVCSFLLADGVSLGPMVLANFFLLSVLSKSLRMIKSGARNDDIFMIGMHMGLAFLFYQPTLILLPVLIFVYMLYSGAKAGQYLLVLVGVAFPALGMWVFYFWYGHVPELLMCMFAPFYKVFTYNLIGLKAQIFYMLLPVGLMVASLVLIAGNYRYIHFQNMAVVFMALWMGAMILMQFLGTARAAFTLYGLVLPMAFFMAHWVQLIHKKAWRETTALGIMLVWLGTSSLANTSLFSEAAFQYRNIYLAPEPEGLSLRGKKIMSLADEPAVYRYNALATPFIKPELFGPDMFNFETYDGMLAFYALFMQDQPELIWDTQLRMEKILDKYPTLADVYQRDGYMLIKRP